MIRPSRALYLEVFLFSFHPDGEFWDIENTPFLFNIFYARAAKTGM